MLLDVPLKPHLQIALPENAPSNVYRLVIGQSQAIHQLWVG
jgi:hypothetical protein